MQQDEIPWLDSSELIDADGEPGATISPWASHNQDSLAPVDLLAAGPTQEYEPPPAVPKRAGWAVFAGLGVLGSSVAALALLGGATHARVQTSTPSAPRQVAALAPLAPLTPLVPAAGLVAPVPAVTARPVVAQSAPTTVASPSIATPIAATTATTTPSAPANPARARRDAAVASAAPHSAPQARPDDLRAAFASLNAGNPREALQRARAIVETDPRRADAWLVLGSAYDALHDRPNAQNAFRNCAEHASGPAVASCKQLVRD